MRPGSKGHRQLLADAGALLSLDIGRTPATSKMLCILDVHSSGVVRSHPQTNVTSAPNPQSTLEEPCGLQNPKQCPASSPRARSKSRAACRIQSSVPHPTAKHAQRAVRPAESTEHPAPRPRPPKTNPQNFTIERKRCPMKAFLILEDGTVFTGTSIGSQKEIISEIVFNRIFGGADRSVICRTGSSHDISADRQLRHLP